MLLKSNIGSIKSKIPNESPFDFLCTFLSSVRALWRFLVMFAHRTSPKNFYLEPEKAKLSFYWNLAGMEKDHLWVRDSSGCWYFK
jgi:hypothetical protein